MFKNVAALAFIPVAILLVAVSSGLKKAQNLKEIEKSKLETVELQRQQLNDQLWEERQRNKELVQEIENWKIRYDEVTIDRERIREMAPQDVSRLVRSVGSLSEEDFRILCMESSSSQLRLYLGAESVLSDEFLNDFYLTICGD